MAPAPLLLQSSCCGFGPKALKKAVPFTFVNSDGKEPSAPGSMSATISVPAPTGPPLLLHGSLPSTTVVGGEEDAAADGLQELAI